MTAPIATADVRNAASFVINLIRGDWDRKGIESALAKHPCQEADVLLVQGIIAAVTRVDQKTPAVLGLDGDHTNRARVALGQPARTPAPLTAAELGGDCAICGVRQAMHRGTRIVTDDIGPHEWAQAPTHVAADPERIRALRGKYREGVTR